MNKRVRKKKYWRAYKEFMSLRNNHKTKVKHSKHFYKSVTYKLLMEEKRQWKSKGKI